MALTRPRLGQLNTSVVSTSDPIQVIHAGSTAANVDIGFLMNRANGLVSNVALYWNESGNTFVTAFTANTGTTDTNVTATSYANVTTGAHIITPGTALTSTSTATGALVVTGGVGISGNLYVGGNVSASNFLGNVFFGPTPTTTYYTQAPLNLTNSLAGGIKTQLNLINTGGGAGAGAGIDFYTYTSVAGSSYPEARIAAVDDGNYSSYITFQTKIPGNTGANALAERLKIDSAGNIVIPSTTVSTNTTTGALVVAGGVGIAGRLNVGANVTVTGNVLPSANVTYSLGSSTQRWKDLWLSGSTIDLSGATIKTDATTGAVAIIPNPTTANPNPSGIVISPAGTVSTVTTTAGVPTAGAISNVSNVATTSSTSTFANANVTSNTASTSTTTGALIVVGGAGVSGNLYIGTNLAVTGTSTFSGNTAHTNTLYAQGIYDNGVRVVSASTGAGNLTISSGAVTLPATGPGATIVGSATSIPTITTDAYGRIVGLTSNAISTSFTLAGTSGTTTVSGGSTLSFASTNGVTVAVGATYANISTPQDIRTSASPSFAGATVNGTLVATTVNAGTIGNTGATLTGTLSTAAQTNITSIGTLTGLTSSGVVSITNSTQSSSTATGALQVTGGIGVQGNVWVGGNLYVANLISTTQSTLVIQDSLVYLQSPTPTGVYNYDIGFYSDYSAPYYVHTGVVRNNTSNTWTFFSNVQSEPSATTINWSDAGIIYDTVKAGAVIIANSTASTSTSSGALQVSGGAGIAGAVYAGSVYDNGTRVVSTSSGAANLTISSGAITLPATGPGAVNVGSATSIPTIVTDAYGRIVGLTSNAISTSFTLAGTSGTTTVSGGNTLSFASTNGVTIAVGATYANISTPQDVRTTASPTFASGTFNGTVIATTLNAATIGNTSANHVGTGTYLTSLTATNIVGTVATANISLYDSVTAYTTNQTFYPTFANLTTGNSTQGTSTTLTYNPSTGALTATSFNGVGTFSTATTSGTLIASGNIVAASSTASTSTTTGALVVTGGVGVSGDAYHGGNVVLTNRSYVKFSPSGSSNWIGLRAPSSLSANVTYNLPSSDGTSGQVLKTDGAGNWSFGSGTAGGSSGFFSSTISVHPSATGDKDLATGADNVTQETPFSSGGTDAFGVSLGIVYDQMEPVGSYTTIDLGSAVAI